MKTVMKGPGKGKTTACFKRALKLLRKGNGVIYINPFSMNRANGLFIDFTIWLEKHKVEYTCEHTDMSIKCGNGRIRFMSYDSFVKYKSRYAVPDKIIFDDLDVLINADLDMITMTVY